MYLFLFDKEYLMQVAHYASLTFAVLVKCKFLSSDINQTLMQINLKYK